MRQGGVGARSTVLRRRTVRRALAFGAVAAVAVGLAAAGYLLFMPGDSTPTTALGPPSFIDETTSSGIDHIYDGDVATFAVGGGVAAFDCDGDDQPELYFAGGSGPSALYRNNSPIGGQLKFTRVPDPATDLVDALGAYPLDVDSDGQIDIVVLRK
jgi:hypothetical protein